MIFESYAVGGLANVGSILDALRGLGDVACNAQCDPNWLTALSRASLTNARVDVLVTRSFTEAEYLDPALITDLGASLLALEGQLTELQNQIQPLPGVGLPGHQLADVRAYAATLDRDDLADLIQAIGRIRNGQIQVGDETAIQAMPHWQDLLLPVVGPWLIVTTLACLCLMDFLYLLAASAGGPPGNQ